MAKNVIVYRDGTVIADSVKMTDVRAVNPPLFKGGQLDELPYMEILITGKLEFSDQNYTPLPPPPSPKNYWEEYRELHARVRKAFDTSGSMVSPATLRELLDGLPVPR